MHVLTFGTYDERSHPRIGVLASGLQRHGHTVTACNVPLGLDTAARVALLHQPWRLPLLLVRLAACWVRLAAGARRGPRPDVVLVGYLGHFDVLLARALFPRTLVALDQLVFAADTAADRGVANGLRPRLLRSLDRIACAAADLVLVDTDENAAIAPPGARTMVVAVGAPEAWSVVHPARVGGPLRVIFYGLFTPLQGAATIAAAGALLNPTKVRLTLVGHGQDLEAAHAAAGDAPLDWVDWVEPEALPQLVADHDVCLGILGTTPKALRVVPNKVFQGAAAGCALVTSDTPPQRRVLGEAALYVPPGDARALAAALTALADDPKHCAQLGRAAATLAAAAFTPEAVTRPLASMLTDLLAEKGIA